MIRISLSSMKQEMITAFSTQMDEIKAEVKRQLEAKISAEGFQEEVSKIIEEKLGSVLREYVGQLVRSALFKKEDMLKAMVMEHVAKLMSEDQVKRLMQE